MKSYIIFLIGIMVSLLIMTGCDESPAKPEFDPDISIFGFLWGGEPLSADHAILITHTQPPDAYYNLNKAAIRNAEITLTDIAAGTSYTLSSDEDNPAYYYNADVIIQPNTSYELSVTTEEETATATTTVPHSMTLESELDEENVNDETHVDLGYEKPIYIDCPVDVQLIMVDMYCNESWENAEYIYPFHDNHKYPDEQSEYDGGANGEPRHIMALVPYNLLKAPDFENRHTIFWYASMIVFYGSNTMQVMAIDDNYHNFLMDEHPVLSGGVENGIGCFGSVCGENYELNILKP
ncbi:DUF4249 family protein [candidate division KSB1 bacterium]|nr:DUF4249 family protein [candidate division KSB1 bacterium]